MSVRVISLVWDGFPRGGSELLALLALADWSDDDGRCFPSMAAIAKKTRLSRAQAQRQVHSLIADGFVTIIENANGGSPGSTRRYRIQLAKLRGLTHATPTGSTGATGSANATGRTHAQEGPHGCAERGLTHATQTVNEPSLTVSAFAQTSFALFWEAYPRKKSKGNAEKAWKKLKLSEQLFADIIAAIERAKTSEQWRKDGGKFIPYPASWLNAKCWEDAADGGQGTNHGVDMFLGCI